ncbi:MAG: hypothetical protein IJI09_06230, partial [Clostridia bacterium]|nr:hypothetical protein [Clostridia bacterium]
MKNTLKRLVAILCAMMMFICEIPVTALSDDAREPEKLLVGESTEFQIMPGERHAIRIDEWEGVFRVAVRPRIAFNLEIMDEADGTVQYFTGPGNELFAIDVESHEGHTWLITLYAVKETSKGYFWIRTGIPENLDLSDWVFEEEKTTKAEPEVPSEEKSVIVLYDDSSNTQTDKTEEAALEKLIGTPAEEAADPQEAQPDEPQGEEPTETQDEVPAETQDEVPEEAQREEPEEIQDKEPAGTQDEVPEEPQDEESEEVQDKEPAETRDEVPEEAQGEDSEGIQDKESAETQDEVPETVQNEESEEVQDVGFVETQDEVPEELQGEDSEEDQDKESVETQDEVPEEVQNEESEEVQNEEPTEAATEGSPITENDLVVENIELSEDEDSIDTTESTSQSAKKTYEALKAGNSISDTLAAGQRAVILVKCGRNPNMVLTLNTNPDGADVTIDHEAEFVSDGNGTYVCVLDEVAFRKFNVEISAKEDLAFTLSAAENESEEIIPDGEAEDGENQKGLSAETQTYEVADGFAEKQDEALPEEPDEANEEDQDEKAAEEPDSEQSGYNAEEETEETTEEVVTSFTCTFAGAQDIQLSEVITDLEIAGEGEVQSFMAEIQNVEATNPDVISLTQTDDDWVLRVLKDPEEQEAVTISMPDETVYTITAAAEGIVEVSTEDEAAVIGSVDELYLPEDANAYVDTLTDAQGEEAFAVVQEQAAEIDDQSACQVFDIGLENVDTEQYNGFEVSINLDEEMVGTDFRLYQVQNGTATDITDTLQLESNEMDNGAENVTAFSFKTEEFAQFVLCYSLETWFTAHDGDTFDIRVDYDPEAGIPTGSELAVREILPGEADYQQYLEASAAQLGVSSENVTFARFFDIEIRKDGEKIEPKTPVRVKISYDDKLELEENAQLSVVHFAENGTEVITDVAVADNAEDGTDLTYVQESFSVTGTIVTEIEASHRYALVVRHEGQYYVVENDGTLFLLDDNDVVMQGDNVQAVKMVNPINWLYEAIGYNNYNLWHDSDAWDYDYSGTHLPTKYTRRYINVDTDLGYVDVNVDPNDPSTLDKWEHAVQYNPQTHRLYHYNNVLGVKQNSDGTLRICGDQNQPVELFFAEVQNVQNVSTWNHTVNHIDIEVSAKQKIKYPLAYGTYKLAKLSPGDLENIDSIENINDHIIGYRDNDLKVYRGNDITLNVERLVPVVQNDIKKADIFAYTTWKGYTEYLNDVYKVTGYSGNADTSSSEESYKAQVRLEGSFKVSDLGEVPLDYANNEDQANYKNYWENGVDTGKKISDVRKERPIYYKVVIEKPVTFTMTYKDTDGQVYVVLLDGEPIRKTFKVSLSSSFSYWDEDNACPALNLPGAIYTKDEWRAGVLRQNQEWTDNLGLDCGPGMDFKLTAPNEDSPHDIVAIEVTKYVEGIDGTETRALSLQDGTSCDINVYQNGSTTTLHVKELNVGKDGFGFINDYDVAAGTYDNPATVQIAEDPDSVADYVFDDQGHKWVYNHSRIETEYAWRNDADPYQYPERHVSKDYTKDDDLYLSHSEYLGEYYFENGIPYTYENVYHDGKHEFNRFLEFYVYNIYEPVGYLKIHKEVTANSNAPVTDAEKEALQGTYTFTVYTDSICEHAYQVAKGDGSGEKEDLTLTVAIGADGAPKDSAIVELPVGEYWIKETDDPDDDIAPVDQIIRVEVTAENYPESKAKEVNFTNNIDTGSLNVTKTVTGIYTVTADDIYPITIMRGAKYVTATLNGFTATYTGLTDSETSFGIHDNETLSFTHMPSGTYTVAEGTVTKTGYSISTTYKVDGTDVTTASADVNKTTPVQVDIYNKYRDAELVITKTIVGVTPSSAAAGIKITVTDSENNKLLDEVLLSGSDSPFSLSGNKYTATLKSTDTAAYAQYLKPEAKYTITETIESEPDGYGLATSTYAITAKTNVATTNAVSGTGYGLQLTSDDTSTGRIDYTNTYVQAEQPHKTEKNPGEDVGVKAGDTITYEINYKNYKSGTETVTVKDKLDAHVEYVSSEVNGEASTAEPDSNKVVTWTIDNVGAGKNGTVTLTVKVLETALESKGGEGKVVNGGDTATVQVGHDPEYTLNEVENPVPDNPVKREITPYVGTGTLGGVKVGDTITYEINYKNYKSGTETVTVKDKLDAHVEYVSSEVNGEASTAAPDSNKVVTWTIDNVGAGKNGTVTLTVKVLETALESKGGEGKVV